MPKMDSFRIIKLANKIAKSSKNGVWCFAHLQLLDFADAIMKDVAQLDTDIMKDMFHERDEEIVALREEIEELKKKRTS